MEYCSIASLPDTLPVQPAEEYQPDSVSVNPFYIQQVLQTIPPPDPEEKSPRQLPPDEILRYHILR